MIRFLLSLFKPFRWFIEKMGANYDQFIRILQLKLTLDDRRANKYSKKKENAQTNTLIKQSLFQIFIGFFFSIFLILLKTPFTYYYFAHTFIMAIMAMMIISEFSTILFDTSENMIIQPLPIKGNTISLARNAHIFIYLTTMALSISVIPVVGSFYRFGIVSGLIFIPTLFLNVLFTLFFANILYLGLMHIVSGEKLKNVLMYFQVAIAIFFMAAYQIGMRMIDKTAIQHITIPIHWYTYLFPPAFFSGFIEAFSTQNFDQSHLIFIVEALFIPPVAIYLTGKYLTPIFNKKLMDLDQGDRVSKVKTETKGNSFYFRTMTNIFAQGKEEGASFRLMWRMTGRERQFKQTVLPAFGYIFIMIILPNVGKGKSLSEITAGYNYLFILYALMMIPLSLCTSLLIGNYQTSTWIFKSLPLVSPANIFKGAIKAAFVKFFIPFFCLFGTALCYFWGLQILPDIAIAFLAIYLITMLMYYNQLPGFPFSMEKTALQGSSNAFRVFGVMALAAILGYSHYLLLKWFDYANLILFPIYGMAIYYVNNSYVIRKITWGKADIANGY